MEDIMVIRHKGRKSGKVRYTPVNYALADGCVYAIAGFGKNFTLGPEHLCMSASRSPVTIRPSGLQR
jgi:hypothetical protein